jgi:phosphoglucosamine mutase
LPIRRVLKSAKSSVYEGMEHYLDWITKEYPTGSQGHAHCDGLLQWFCFSYTAERALKTLGAELTIKDNTPNGVNINKDCGSTHPENFISFHEG